MPLIDFDINALLSTEIQKYLVRSRYEQLRADCLAEQSLHAVLESLASILSDEARKDIEQCKTQLCSIAFHEQEEQDRREASVSAAQASQDNKLGMRLPVEIANLRRDITAQTQGIEWLSSQLLAAQSRQQHIASELGRLEQLCLNPHQHGYPAGGIHEISDVHGHPGGVLSGADSVHGHPMMHAYNGPAAHGYITAPGSFDVSAQILQLKREESSVRLEHNRLLSDFKKASRHLQTLQSECNEKEADLAKLPVRQQQRAERQAQRIGRLLAREKQSMLQLTESNRHRLERAIEARCAGIETMQNRLKQAAVSNSYDCFLKALQTHASSGQMPAHQAYFLTVTTYITEARRVHAQQLKFEQQLHKAEIEKSAAESKLGAARRYLQNLPEQLKDLQAEVDNCLRKADEHSNRSAQANTQKMACEQQHRKFVYAAWIAFFLCIMSVTVPVGLLLLVAPPFATVLLFIPALLGTATLLGLLVKMRFCSQEVHGLERSISKSHRAFQDEMQRHDNFLALHQKQSADLYNTLPTEVIPDLENAVQTWKAEISRLSAQVKQHAQQAAHFRQKAAQEPFAAMVSQVGFFQPQPSAPFVEEDATLPKALH